MSKEPQKGLNRLAGEKSPYLLQHAANPVDWYPWGDEAFERARVEDKPVFLSIGYSTCHWCHVMERESFEDPEVARLMNESMVSVKVDREERPDLDGIYMTAAQMLSGQSGWPLSIFLTPDRKPFFAATYIPRASLFDRPGMLELLPRVSEVWKKDRAKIEDVARQVVEELNRPAAVCSGEAPGSMTVDAAYGQLAQMFDQANGGFGRKPKFPSAHNLSFLLRYWKCVGERAALDMVERTLVAMRLGGLFDHLGYGFHRYSTDEKWLLPHFEKMLYDQAMLSMAFAEAYQATDNAFFKRTAIEVLTYALRDLASPVGGFYSAEDADSEGVEGKFYLWSRAELDEILDAPDAELAARVYGVEAKGNFREEASGETTGWNVLHLPKPMDHLADELEIPVEKLENRVEAIRKKLFEAREARVRPLRDDKILADWNGLMIAALAKAAKAFDAPEYAEAARKAATFIRENLARDGRLLHRYRQGQADIPGFLDDYAFMIWGLIELYEATFEAGWLEWAIELNRVVLSRFGHREVGGFFLAPDDGLEAIARQKDAYDGALPSGNSVMMMNLLRLGRMTGEPELEREAEKLMNAFFCSARKAPAAYTQMIAALHAAIEPSCEIVIAGKPGAEDTLELARAARRKFSTGTVIMFKPAGQELGAAGPADFLGDYKEVDGKAAAYVCRNFTCEKPVTSAAEMESLLDGRGGKTKR